RRDLVGPLRSSALAELAVDDDLDARTAQALRHAEREVRAYRDASRAARFKKAPDDLGIELLARGRRLLDLAGAEVVDVEDITRARLLARSAFLERVRDDRDLAVLLE